MTRVRQFFNSECHSNFIDSTGSVDTHSLAVSFIMIATCVGALPIGMIITGEKTEAAYSKAFEQLRDLTVQIDANSKWDAEIVMTDHDDAIRNAVKKLFPNAVLWLCTFHVLQAVWRYLFSKKAALAKPIVQ